MRLSNFKYRILFKFRACCFLVAVVGLIGCSTSNNDAAVFVGDPEEIPDLPDLSDPSDESANNETVETIQVKYLALGDSYTIGTGVCSTCSYPEQLKDSLLSINDPIYETSVDIIAQSGWTTAKLLDEIEISGFENNFDLVSLLIGVNNQFQNQPFEVYEEEFIQLLNKAIQYTQNIEDRVVVISIPDYAFSSFGQNWGNPEMTSQEIDNYNNYAKSICDNLNITFLNITDISRQALERPELLASDGLHLSELAYSEIVERLLPIIRVKLDSN